MQEFITKHQSKVVGTLSGFDRVRFRGTLRMLSAVPGLMAFLFDHQVRLTHFKPFVEKLTATLKDAVEHVASAAGRSIRFLASSQLSKEDLVRELLAREGLKEGVVCVLSAVEPCRSYEIHRDRETKTIDPVPRLRKCLHWYVYILDAVFGLCHVRIQSWLPFAVHICINGREWLCGELTAAGIGFQRRDNCLIDVADFSAAQRLADAQLDTPWESRLNELLNRACPALADLSFRREPLRYYWSAEETEWATDLLFRSSADLADIYPALIHHGMTTFSSPNVMRFLGRCVDPERAVAQGRFQGEVVTDLQRRPEGVRIKHSINGNSIKMYDKQGSVLRVETTINNSRDMKVFRASETDPEGPKTWNRLRKGVADLTRRCEISHAANMRYLTALGAVETQTPFGKLADGVSAAVEWQGQRARGLNPLTGEDARCAEVLLRGEFTINGFRNKDLRQLLHPETQDEHEVRRQSGKITRLIRLFRAHGLIKKVQGTHRYQLTAEGRRCLPAFAAARAASSEKLCALVA